MGLVVVEYPRLADHVACCFCFEQQQEEEYACCCYDDFDFDVVHLQSCHCGCCSSTLFASVGYAAVLPKQLALGALLPCRLVVVVVVLVLVVVICRFVVLWAAFDSCACFTKLVPGCALCFVVLLGVGA